MGVFVDGKNYIPLVSGIIRDGIIMVPRAENGQLTVELIRRRQYKKRGAWKPWAEADDARILRLYRDGILPSEIARGMDRTATAVSSRIGALRKMGKVSNYVRPMFQERNNLPPTL